MKHAIIGTAGHVDHGKTCLIKALTGIDTDRLKEEKKRGITIELGFAYLDMPDGSRAGIVDVPGHEKFIKNMLAGAGGIDLAMLVVAADEGVMPQTVEHLDILSILGIRKGVVVITKTDLVERDFLDLVIEDIRELTKDTFMEYAPIVPVSVYKEEGLESLKQVLIQSCLEIPERVQKKEFRLPIDRVFTLKGFGTVVTGTLVEGEIKKDQEAVFYPENKTVKIRSIQVHDSDRNKAFAGQRVAVNIPDRKKEEIVRGNVLALKNSLYPTDKIDVRVEALKHTKYEIKHGSRVHIYHGTKELLGKIILMDREKLQPGDSCYAQLRLEEETVVRKGDRFVIRFYSPAETIGGGMVLDACPCKHKRKDPGVLTAFAIKEKGTSQEMLETALRESWGCFYGLDELCRRNSLDGTKVKHDAKELLEKKKILKLWEDVYLHREEFEYYRKKAEDFLGKFHAAYPLKEGMSVEEARNRLGLPNLRYTDAMLELLKEERIIKEQNKTISRREFQIVMKKGEDAVKQRILKDYLEAGLAPQTTEIYSGEYQKEKSFKAVFSSLIHSGELIRLDGQYCLHRDFYEKAKNTFEEMEAEKHIVITGEFRDYLGCSRKMAIALLEHFDREGFTKKVEEGRILKGRGK